ncbi:MAG: hypothetical protein ACFKPT_13005 [Gloeotrichia echinulata GP01]
MVGDLDPPPTPSNTARLSPKTLTRVGWVEALRNPTNPPNVGFRKASTQPTIFLNRAVLQRLPPIGVVFRQGFN